MALVPIDEAFSELSGERIRNSFANRLLNKTSRSGNSLIVSAAIDIILVSPRGGSGQTFRLNNSLTPLYSKRSTYEIDYQAGHSLSRASGRAQQFGCSGRHLRARLFQTV